MAERPTLFISPLVRAIRDGRKTKTRRIVNWRGIEPGLNLGFSGLSVERSGSNFVLTSPTRDSHAYRSVPQPCPYGRPGDHVWVRETFYAWGHWTKRHNAKKGREEWHFVDETLGAGLSYRYEADERLPRRKRELHEVAWWKRPAIFMPRAACRLTVEITDVRVERLQAISEADAVAEGVSELPEQKGEAGAWWSADATAGAHLHGRTPQGAFRRLWEAINGADSWAADPWVWVLSLRRLP